MEHNFTLITTIAAAFGLTQIFGFLADDYGSIDQYKCHIFWRSGLTKGMTKDVLARFSPKS